MTATTTTTTATTAATTTMVTRLPEVDSPVARSNVHCPPEKGSVSE